MNKDTLPLVDAIITTYNECSTKLNITLQSCLNQSFPFNKIFLIDDGSIFFDKTTLLTHSSIEIIQLDTNRGISAARNIAIKLSNTPFFACINAEIEIEKQWVEKLIYIISKDSNHNIAAAFGTLKTKSASIYSKWRMRFHEQHYAAISGFAEFAPGHAVLFRKIPIEQISGYTESLKLVHEDADICMRLKEIDQLTFYSHEVSVVSNQNDSLRGLGKKHFIRMTVGKGKKLLKIEFIKILFRDHFNRNFRNLLNFRIRFFFIDFLISYYCIKIYFSK